VRSTFVSDFGGVLTVPLSLGFRAYQQESGVSTEELGHAMARAAVAHGDHPLFALERGEITEAEFGALLARELPDGFNLARMRELLFEHLAPNEPMIEFARELRSRGKRTALLTNNVREWEPLWRSKLPEIDEIFEVVVDSAFVGMRKPEPAIYELTLARLGVAATDCVFLDDLDVNCEAARELGMLAVRFEDTAQAVADLEAAFSEA
jgi:putative hydrolase of the HAD superfamily